MAPIHARLRLRARCAVQLYLYQRRRTGGGRFGPATKQPVEILGITHAEVDHARSRILREWVLIDEVALWMQLLTP